MAHGRLILSLMEGHSHLVSKMMMNNHNHFLIIVTLKLIADFLSSLRSPLYSSISREIYASNGNRPTFTIVILSQPESSSCQWLLHC